MIIVRLQGGTGNQMFQYASAKALSLELKTTLKIDLSYLEKAKLGANVDSRNYGLSSFNIKENIISKADLDKFTKKCHRNRRLKLGAINRILFGYKLPIPKIYEETSRKYNHQFLKLSPNTLLVGYWQVPAYFQKYENIIREEFSFKSEPNHENQSLLDQMNKESSSVAMHIRRGDFSKLDKLGVTDISYYEKAIALLRKKISEPSFYFFGDDMNWIREKMKHLESESKVVYVDINARENEHNNDIRLISNCKHQIIGNSTFAWWGAWLNSNPDKLVFAPLMIFNDPAINSQVQDMIPPNWIRL